MVDAGVVQAAVIVLGLFVTLIVCSLFKSRPRPHTLTHGQLDEIRIRRESEKEVLLEDKAKRLRERAQIHRHNRLLLTTRKETGLLLHGAQELWDAKGRQIYGDAWDEPESGTLPLKALFDLPKEEIDSVRDEARKLVQSGWAPSESADHGANLAFEMSPLAKQGHSSNKDERRARKASARRGPASSRPSPGAPYVDTRFVHAPPPSIVPRLDFTRLSDGGGSHFPVVKPFQDRPRIQGAVTAAAPMPTVYNADIYGRDISSRIGGVRSPRQAASDRITNTRSSERNPDELRKPPPAPVWYIDDSDERENGDGVKAASLQAPGLSHPRPPDVPVPRLSSSARTESPPAMGRESLSARLARLAGSSGNFGRVVPVDLV